MIADWQTLISWQNSDLVECMLFGHTPALHIQLEVIRYSDLVRSLPSLRNLEGRSHFLELV